MSARTAAGVACASALIAGGLVPTTAYANSHDGAQNHGREAHIKVCKYYDEDEDQYFYFKSWTEDRYDTYNFKLRDHRCKSYYIEYDEDEPYYYLKESTDTITKPTSTCTATTKTHGITAMGKSRSSSPTTTTPT